MDLAYTDNNGEEIEVLGSYDMDLSFGNSENDFELTIPLSKHCMMEDYRIAAYDIVDGKEMGTEYGGIVDAIKPDARNNQVTYKGRTWHGVLEGHVIEPEAGYDYLLLDGDANACIKELIDNMNLSGLFEVDESDSGIVISAYQMERYVKGYTGIRKMLSEHDAKLKMEYHDRKVHLSAVPVIDYSQDEEFDTDKVNFSVQRTYNTVNHVICAGQGDLSERYVIHLFTDENGGVQPYVKEGVAVPLQDSDYILDKSNQMLFGDAEIADFKDYKSADVTENYILLIRQPGDWPRKYGEYFYYDEEDDKYKQVESKVIEDVPTLLTSIPSNWSKEYNSYYIKDEDNPGKYKTVAAVKTDSYSKLTKRPKDWVKNYDNYYYRYTDGVTVEYRSADGVTKYKYKQQTRKPTDWDKSYTSYYQRKKDGGYEHIPSQKNKKAPKWVKGKYFTRISITKTPSFKNGTYYCKTVKESVPAFKTGTYYEKNDILKAPPYVDGKYYRKVLDHYAVMVQEALEEIEERLQNCDSIDLDLDASINYDIGDMVGAIERITGIYVIQPITQKIVTINSGNKKPTIRYEVGEGGY